ncbi:MAG: carboxy terminal-processing peptidase [Lentisphaeria bacterium]|nr:carboxy terminal-processing peptidase [Lentisphaeria bacterium]
MNVFTRKICVKVLFSVIAAAAVFCPHVPAYSAQIAAQSESSAPTSVSLKKPDRKMGLIASLVVQLLAKEHYTKRQMDAAFSGEVFDEYLRFLDPTRIFFLQEDVDMFAKSKDDLARKAAAGDVQIAFDIFNLRSIRLAEYCDFARDFLSKPIQYDPDETYHIDREDAPWPKDAEEQHAIWAKRIKNELIVARMSDKAAEEEAKESAEERKKEKSDAPQEDGSTEKEDEAPAPAVSLLPPEKRVQKRVDQLLITVEGMDPIDVLEGYLTSFANVCDPHSTYMSPATGEDFDIHISLNLSGIGAVLSSEDGYTKVVEVVQNGPADKEGTLRENDRIIAVAQEDGETVDVMDMPLSKVVTLIRGKEGSRVTLTILPARKGAQAAPEKVTITRGNVPMNESHAQSRIIEAKTEDGQTRKIGLIELPSFYVDFAAVRRGDKEYNSSGHDVLRILNEFADQKIDGLIVDLRSNGGGSLTEAVDLSGFFIPDGPIVQVKDKASTSVLRDNDRGQIAYAGPMLVLVNRYSASATEIFSAALKDYHRAVVVGDPHTHGKGSVQVVTDLNNYMLYIASERFDAGQLKLTNAKFYRINGESTQIKGVEADIPLPGFSETEETGERALRHALPYDTIRPARYSVYDGKYAVTPGLISELKAKSEARVAEDPLFKRLLADVALYDELRNNKDVALDFDKRWAEYEREKAIQKEQDTIYKSDRASSSSKKNKKDDDPDPYLDESVNIMLDMIRAFDKQENP